MSANTIDNPILKVLTSSLVVQVLDNLEKAIVEPRNDLLYVANVLLTRSFSFKKGTLFQSL